MDLIHNFQDYATELLSKEDVRVKQKNNSELAQASESDDGQGSFDCNICYESAKDPVVTLCGHLYCWACIFKWFHVKSTDSEPVLQQACPVCKANISQTSLIPLYGSGASLSEPELGKLHHDVIPPRPTASGLRTLVAAANSHSEQLPVNPFQLQSPAFHHQRFLTDPRVNHSTISSSNVVSPTMAGIINPTIALLSELVDTRMFRSTGSSIFNFPLPSSYAIIGHNSPRIRRQELEVEKSLNRISIFLFCCMVLCLLLF